MASSAKGGRQPGGRPPPSPLLASPRPEQPNFFRPRYYTKRQVEDEAPSVKAGMSLKRVAIFRKGYVNMIQNVCKLMGLSTFVCVAAITFCHHFYLARTMQKNDKMLVAMAAIFLATKSENFPEKLEKVLHASFKDQYGKDKEQATRMAAMLRDRQQYEWLRDSVLKAERALLYTLGFRFQVGQPSNELVEICTKYKLNSFYKPANPKTAPKLSQIAANFLNDSWKGTLSLQYPTTVLATGCLYSAIKITHTEVPLTEDGKPWYELASGMTQAQMEAFDAELLKGYKKESVPAAKKGGGKVAATGKPMAGGKPGALRQGPAAAHVPPAPGTPVSASSTPVQRLGGAARERTPEEGQNGGVAAGEPAAKRARMDAGSAAAAGGSAAAAAPAVNGPAAPAAADGIAAPAQQPNGVPQQAQQAAGSGGAPMDAAPAGGALLSNGPAIAAAPVPGAPAPASMPPGLAAAATGQAQPGNQAATC